MAESLSEPKTNPTHRPRGLSRVSVCSVLLLLAALVGSSACDTTAAAVDEDRVSLGGEFEPGNLLSNEGFTQSSAALGRIDSFLTHTPYKGSRRRSFLATYYSNGYVASFGLLSASAKYRVTPRLLLAILQARRGLVGMPRYPVSNPASVEYAFDCGCTGPQTCDVALGGLDRQLDCLGAQLRAAYDDARLLGKTARGYGKGIEFVSVDGVNVTPQSDATAAIYEISPRVGQSDKSGAWLIWNVFVLYGSLEDETLEGGQSVLDRTLVGASCTKNAECDDSELVGAQCRTFGAVGACTVRCDGSEECLDTTITGEAGLCVALSSSEKICLPKCDPTKKGQCGEFLCVPRKDPSGKTINVCVPGEVT